MFYILVFSMLQRNVLVFQSAYMTRWRTHSGGGENTSTRRNVLSKNNYQVCIYVRQITLEMLSQRDIPKEFPFLGKKHLHRPQWEKKMAITYLYRLHACIMALCKCSSSLGELASKVSDGLLHHRQSNRYSLLKEFLWNFLSLQIQIQVSQSKGRSQWKDGGRLNY